MGILNPTLPYAGSVTGDMRTTCTVRVDFRKLDELIGNAKPKADAVIDSIAKLAVSIIKANILIMGAVDTGHLLESIHDEPGESAGTRYVVAGANYAFFVNFGHLWMHAPPSGILGYKPGVFIPRELYIMAGALGSSGPHYAPPRPFWHFDDIIYFGFENSLRLLDL